MAEGDKSKKSNKNPKKGHDRADAQPKSLSQQKTSTLDPRQGYYAQTPQIFSSSNLGAPSNADLHGPSQLPSGEPSVPLDYASPPTMQHFPLPNPQFPTQSGGNQYDMTQFTMTDTFLYQGTPRRDSDMSRMAVTGSPPKHSRNPSRELGPAPSTGIHQIPEDHRPPNSFERVDLMDSMGVPAWTQLDADHRNASTYGDRFSASQTAGFVHTSHVRNDLNSNQPYSDPSNYMMPPNWQPQQYYKGLEGNNDYGEDDQGEGYTSEQTEQPSTSKGKENPKDKKKHKRKERRD